MANWPFNPNSATHIKLPCGCVISQVYVYDVCFEHDFEFKRIETNEQFHTKRNQDEDGTSDD